MQVFREFVGYREKMNDIILENSITNLGERSICFPRAYQVIEFCEKLQNAN